jgi:hypothetical protein
MALTALETAVDLITRVTTPVVVVGLAVPGGR